MLAWCGDHEDFFEFAVALEILAERKNTKAGQDERRRLYRKLECAIMLVWPELTTAATISHSPGE